MSVKIRVGIAALAFVLTIAFATPIFAATAVQADGIITEILVGRGDAAFVAQDTHDTGTTTITATFSPAAVKGVPNLTQPDNVQALVAAMKAPDWGNAMVGSAQVVFSPGLLTKFQAAGVNVGWVYQRLYAHMDPGATPPPYVPRVPQAVYLNGQGPVAQVPKPAAAQPTPVVVQHPIMGTQTETVPSAAKATNPVASTTTAAQPAAQPAAQLVSNATPKSAAPAQQIAQAKAQESQNAVVAVKPSPKAPAVLVNGAHIAPGWRAAQKAIGRVRAAQQRTQREDLAVAALAVLVGLFFLVQRLRHAWPFRRRVELW